MTPVSNIAVNVHIQAFGEALGIYLGVKLLGPAGLLSLVKKPPDGFLQWLRHRAFPPAPSVVSSFSASLPAWVTFHFSDCSVLVRMSGGLTGFDCHLVMTGDAERLSCAVYGSSPGQHVFGYFAHFLVGHLAFYHLALVPRCLAVSLQAVCRLPSHVVGHALNAQSFSLRSRVYLFSQVAHAFGVIAETPSPNPRP